MILVSFDHFASSDFNIWLQSCPQLEDLNYKTKKKKTRLQPAMWSTEGKIQGQNRENTITMTSSRQQGHCGRIGDHDDGCTDWSKLLAEFILFVRVVMTPGLNKDIWCHVWWYTSPCLQITRSDIRAHVGGVVSLVITDVCAGVGNTMLW